MDLEHRRLVWRCRRGTKELDVLLERYVREYYPNAPPARQQAFARFLELPDYELEDYLLHEVSPVDPELAQIARLIGAYGPTQTVTGPANAG